MKTIKETINLILNRKVSEFPDAKMAYQRSTYQEIYTKEQLRDKIIEDLKMRIKEDIKIRKTHLDITTYSGYREKLVLPEVAEFFRSLMYNVDLLNKENYQDINVLIINWQNLETFK